MSNESNQNIDDARLAALLRSLAADAPPPDESVLAALRDRSAQAFPEPSPVTPPARRSMFSLPVRIVAAVLASAAAILLLISPWSAKPLRGAAPFSEVISALREAQTLHLRVQKEDQSAEVWIRRPGLLRREESPQRYQIAAGSRLWQVDESTNTVTSGDSPWFRSAEQQIDLVALLDVGVEDASALLEATPVEQIEYNGRQCFVYRVDLATASGKVEIEAFADAATLELAAIVAHPAGAARKAGPPLAELQLVAINAPAEDDKFVVAKSLTEDGRIGTVSDAQGVVVVRPLLAKRWTPICRDLLLKPGDWLRTELRGANALKVTLSSEVQITLGPGSLLECISPTEARLHTGSAQVNVPKRDGAAFELLAPRTGSRKFTAGKQLVRVDREEKLVDVPQQPVWLAGFEGTTANESLGSLIVNLPDGRNEPLTVGYHKVKVEIRDQIARTTIEESFVNHTNARLEGTFHFPLPQDASISGFGMWIGNDLVEADIVEKQRAREIYETILREKRDPGLLEWTGGNLFKARVFPIEARSEKRIKIVYTQVLPLRAGRYRYNYSLRSELLRTRPLRELSLSVTVASALPLKSIACPTHAARIQQAEHAGQVEFAAQEYSPSRDFEVVCEVAPGQADVVLVPHRRGSDGYFLLQVTPPGGDGKLQRELVADGQGMNLVLLCDTSASMDAQKRKEQAEFVATVLSSLGDDDRFQLAAADVGTEWAFSEPLPANAENRAKALAFLDARLSLGWTNLDRAFAAALKKSPAHAQIIYIGDGLVSAGDTDPASFVKRLGRLLAGDKRVLHAITVGNTHEAVVLQGIAAHGGGSVRAIGGEQTAQMVAMELLHELTQPGLRDLNIEFRGVKVAAVYPDRLPNVAAGTQQIVVGRFLPEGKDQQGEVVVTGTRGGEKVRYVAKINLKDAEEGNSFIPRLWARGHLDHLLAQGSSQAIRDNIIALSEEFHIITPYTSLLVLETDADRERFGVQRRYEMRDGERFFADGASAANFELLKQQMQRAGDWRIGLRRQVLRDLATLGRDPHQFQRQVDRLERYSLGLHDEWNSPRSSSTSFVVDDLASLQSPLADRLGDKDSVFIDAEVDKAEAADWGGLETDEKLKVAEDMDVARKDLKDLAGDGEEWDIDSDRAGLSQLRELEAGGEYAESRLGLEFVPARLKKRLPGGRGYGGGGGFGPAFLGKPQQPASDDTAWVDTIFPALAPRPQKPAAAKEIDPEAWSPEALALSRSLLRVESLRKLDGGLVMRRTWDTFEPRWKRRSSRNVELTLYSPTAWLKRSLDLDDYTTVDYCDAQEREVFALATLLGRVRNSTPQELDPAAVVVLQDMSIAPLHAGYWSYVARVEEAGENRAKLILAAKNSTYEIHFTIDTARHVVLQHESFDEGKSTGVTTFEDFVEIAGTWWSQKQTTKNAKGETIATIEYEFSLLAKDKFAARIATELAPKAKVQFLHLPLAKLRVARQRVADGSADFDDHLVMMLHSAARQQWEELLAQLEAAEKLAADKPGVKWLRTVLLSTMRRNEEARQRLLAEARDHAANKRQDDLWQAEFLLGQARGVTSTAEFLEFVEILKPVYERQPADLAAMPRWQAQLLSCYDGLGRVEEALAISKQIAEQAPWNYYQQVAHAQRLSAAGEPDAALAWLQKELDRPIEREAYEDEVLRSALADTLRGKAKWVQLLEFTTAWIAREPAYAAAYQQHLSALVFNDRLDDANALAEKWLKESQVPGKLPAAKLARLDAAISFAQGNGYRLSFYRMDQRWMEPLAATAKFFATHEHHFDVTRRILGYGVSESEAGDRLRGYFLSLLQNDLAKLSSEQVAYFVSMTLSGRLEPVAPINGRKHLDGDEVPLEVWTKIAEQVRERWTKADDKDDKHRFSDALAGIYMQRFPDKYLPFLRERITVAPPEYKATYQRVLFNTLLSQPWTEAVEQESLALIEQLSDATEPSEQLAAQVPALYGWVDAMLANRQAAAERALGDGGGLDKLTRKQLAEKKSEFRKTARAAVAARLGAAAQQSEQNKSPLAPWLAIEQAWLDVQLDQRLAEVEELCWQILGEAPPKVLSEEELEALTPAQHGERFFQAVLRQRAFVTVMNLAARRKAQPATIAHVLKYLDGGIALDPETALPWRLAKFRFLVALDRPDDLERELRAWIRADVSTAPWRMMLAHLLAERGKLDEAITLFEAAEKDKLLTAADYRLLADWQLVKNRRADHDRLKLEAFKQLPENHLAQRVYQYRQRWYRTDRPLPSELDEETLLTFKALFEKSAHPENYLYYLRDLYAACRDFRLLHMLPDAMLGRSPQQVYAFLNGVQSQVLQELRNEATADEIIGRIKQLRAGERTVTDLRALDLLEALVERRSSEVLNQPGPHADACLAALERAFDRDWGEGEPRLMSSFLAQLGTLRDPRLIEEQLRELRALQKLAPDKSRDHLSITADLANTLFWSYHRRDEAIQEMETEVRAYERAHDGHWPQADNELFGGYVRLLEGANRHAAGEQELKTLLAGSKHEEQRKWTRDRLLSLYNHALEHDGEVSFGKGAELLTNLFVHVLQELEAADDENVRYNIVSRLVTIFDTARRKKIAGHEELVRRFAFDVMPKLLEQQQAQYRNTAAAPTGVIHESLGPKVALQYIIERMEQYPQRLEIGWESSWNTFGHDLAYRRQQAAEAKLDLGDLSPRLLKLVIAELKRDLRTGESRNRYLYHNDHGYFWTDKAGDFAAAANEVYAERKGSGRSVLYIAHYFWHGLDMHGRAIEILLVAQRDGILDEAAQDQLVEYLHLEKRYAESIPILEGLMARRPDALHHRTRLMIAYFHAQRPDQLRELRVQTDAHFHKDGRWTPVHIAALAKACLTTQLHELAVDYFREAISLYQRQHGGASAGDATLSDWYQHQALAHTALGQTKAAVEAASAAIVCWGADRTERRDALAALTRALTDAKDLDGYVKHLDAETAKTGQDSPLLRKAIGQVYQTRGQHDQAIAQFELAVALQPNDKEIHQALIACYDATERQQDATRQLIKLIDLERHELALYQQLAERLKEDEAEAERAATSIIEAAPGEAENHAAMAELRQQQKRWDEALPHWRQVAELRRLEPTGFLKLAAAQLHEKQFDEARATIKKLQQTEWPARFTDVAQQTRELEAQLPK